MAGKISRHLVPAKGLAEFQRRKALLPALSGGWPKFILKRDSFILI